MKGEYKINHQDFYAPLLKEQQAFEEKQRLCKIVGYVLDAYINMMEEEKELAEYRKFYDENGKDEKLWELLKNYEEIREATDECIKHCIQMSSIPEMGGFKENATEDLRKNERSCANAKDELDVYIKKMEEEEMAKPKHSSVKPKKKGRKGEEERKREEKERRRKEEEEKKEGEGGEEEEEKNE
ncbi:hypothetical protein niasHT_035970 [Heterodera trifolii]|uniref:Uncharacterized protein n=1 Tax=Heterodera trifolii TaxID=157864 RepID=A0ABD2I8J9_9BILA